MSVLNPVELTKQIAEDLPDSIVDSSTGSSRFKRETECRKAVGIKMETPIEFWRSATYPQSGR